MTVGTREIASDALIEFSLECFVSLNLTYPTPPSKQTAYKLQLRFRCAGTVAGQPGGCPAAVSSLKELTGCGMDYLKDKYLFVTVLLAVVISCNGQTILGVQHFARQRLEQESWAKIARHAEDRPSDELHRELKISLFAPNSNYNYSLQCIEDVLFYVDSLVFNRSQWALESKPFFSIPIKASSVIMLWKQNSNITNNYHSAGVIGPASSWSLRCW